MAANMVYENEAAEEGHYEDIPCQDLSKRTKDREAAEHETPHEYDKLQRRSRGELCGNRRRWALILGFLAAIVVTNVAVGVAVWYIPRITGGGVSDDTTPVSHDSNGTSTTIPNKDECASSPCMNNGTCEDHVDGYNCTCPSGYTGNSCQQEIYECASNPCVDGGICADRVDGYKCTCLPGYTGSSCQHEIDECASSPCLNNGTCEDQVGGYNCTCPFGFTGNLCQQGCGEGWVFSNVTDHCYVGITNGMNWQAARSFCETLGATLASSRSPAEQDVLEEIIGSIGETGKHYWIGGNDLAKEGNWVWLNGEPIGPWLAWHKAEPNNERNEDCMEIYPGWVIYDNWNDEDCLIAYRFICSKAAQLN